MDTALAHSTRFTPQSKPFAWSYSKLKNFETCAQRHQQVDLLKSYREDESDQLTWGNAVHKAMADRIKSGLALPPGMGQYEKWASNIDAMPGVKHVEMKLAIDRDFGACGFFERGAWFRGVVDVAVIQGVVAWAGDWKTGKVLEDSAQLGLMAACLFAHQPSLRAVKTNFMWLKENIPGVDEIYHRDQMAGFWAGILPRVQVMEQAHITNAYPPMPSRLCRNWCPVRSCPHHGT